MLLAGHQPNYLPYLGFFHKIAIADRFVIVDNVQFVKRGPFGWIHRNRIRTPTEEGWQWLSVPTLTSGKFTQTIREAKIDNRTPWRRKHWRSIEAHYAKAPHFEAYAAPLRAIYEREWEGLADLSEALIGAILGAFGIRTPVERASDLGVSGKATEYVIDLCKKAGADSYLSGIHGRDYLDPDRFKREGIDLRFQEFVHPAYPQAQKGGFVPNLAAIDLLFNCGPESLEILTGRE